MAKQCPIDVFTYENYRNYLNDYYRYMKDQDPKFSHRVFSKQAKYTSTNFMLLVMQGKRNVSDAGAQNIAEALKLSKGESDFFKALVKFNQETDSEQKQRLALLLFRFKNFEKNHPQLLSEYSYYAKWYNIPIREMVDIKGFKEKPEWIAKKLSPPIEASEAKEALQELKNLGFLKYDDNKKLVQTVANVMTNSEVISASVRAYHHEMINKAGEAIERHKSSKREISSSTITVDEEGMKKIKKIIQNVWEEIRHVSNETKEPTAVYQLNFQLFPLVNQDEDENE